MLLTFLKAVQNQLNTRRDAQFIEYPKQIISHDLLLARGFSPVQVALLCYVVAILLAGMSWKELAMSPVQACVATTLSFAALAVVEVWLGSLQVGHTHRPSPVSLRAAPTKRAPVP
jgi:hypothetical protein